MHARSVRSASGLKGLATALRLDVAGPMG